MKTIQRRPLNYFILIILVSLALPVNISCEGEKRIEEDTGNEDNPGEVGYKLPNIDLSNWYLTLPIEDPEDPGDALTIEPPEILNYATNKIIKPFMYNDSTDGSLVFYTYPEASTPNSSYSRTELREQMVPGSNDINWTFEEGGRMKGTLSVPEISKDEEGEFHKTMVMQIHGRLTNEQRDLIGENDNNAPPILKIYWYKGKVRVKTKVLEDLNDSDTEILYTNAWGDDEGYNFPDYVGTDKFTLEIIASKGRVEVILNEKDTVIYDNIHMERWNLFENYFKAGNYLSSTDENAYAKVKYYSLEVSH